MDDSVQVTEGGTVQLTVVLQGEQPTCGGKIRYETVDGSAKQPQDYVKKEGELTFADNSTTDRRQTITVQTKNDSADEPNETFTVRLSDVDPNDEISPGGSPATITIADNDATPQSSTPKPSPKKSTTPTSRPRSTTAASPRASASPSSPSPSATASPSAGTLLPTPTVDATDLGAPAGDEGSSPNTGLIAGIALGVVLLGIAGLLVRRRLTS